jgi:hypothetical protein
MRTRLGGVSLVVIGLALLLTGCAGTSDADAPYSVAGLNLITGPAAPGEPSVVGVPTAIRTGSVVLESATLVQLSGFPLPHMVGVGLVPGKDWLSGGWGWPPVNAPVRQATVGVGRIPVRPLAGYVLTAGHPIAIYYAFSGDRAGQTYYAAGIRLKYRRGTQDYAVTLYQVGADCVVAGFPKVSPTCTVSSEVDKQIEALPHS